MSVPKRGWILYEQATARRIWNATKNRHETWVMAPGKDWLLVKGDPIDLTHDNFIAPVITTWVALYGISSQMQWQVTGRPNPSGANFAQVNELGGGLEVKTRPQTDRWVAVHFGGVYPFCMSESPHIYIKSSVPDITNVHAHVGMVGATNKPVSGSVHTLSDDGIWIELDTNVDNKFRSVTRSGGVETSKILAPADTDHHNFCIRVNDDGDEVEFLIDGTVLQTHNAGDNLPTGVHLQSYYEVMARENTLKNIHLHHYIQIFDALWV